MNNAQKLDESGELITRLLARIENMQRQLNLITRAKPQVHHRTALVEEGKERLTAMLDVKPSWTEHEIAKELRVSNKTAMRRARDLALDGSATILVERYAKPDGTPGLRYRVFRADRVIAEP